MQTDPPSRGSSRCCRLEVDFTHSRFLLPVIPAEAGIQLSPSVFWIPVFTGMTIPITRRGTFLEGYSTLNFTSFTTFPSESLISTFQSPFISLKFL
jgi:hypothetical protein